MAMSPGIQYSAENAKNEATRKAVRHSRTLAKDKNVLF